MDPLQKLIRNIRKLGLESIGLYYSTYTGYVVDNLDIKNQNRLLVYLPTIFGNPSSPMWLYPKAASPRVHNLPSIGDIVSVEFHNGRPSSGVWSYAQPLKDSKPPEFRSEKVYGFKSPAGHLVMIDEIDNLITIRHKDGQIITIKKDSFIINSPNILLTSEEAEEQSPLGNTLDSDINKALGDLADIVDGLIQYTSTQVAACTITPLTALVPGLTSLGEKLLQVKSSLVSNRNKFQDASHLSDKVKLS